jgi:hypothetical protein
VGVKNTTNSSRRKEDLIGKKIFESAKTDMDKNNALKIYYWCESCF